MEQEFKENPKDPYDIDVKIINSFKTEDYKDYESIFKAIDVDKNGYIDEKEMLKMMHDLGYRSLGEADIKKIIEEVDLNHDGVVSFFEFLMMMKKFKDTGEDTQFTRIVTKSGKGMVRIKDKSSKDTMSFQTFSEEERSAYVKMINQALGDDPDLKDYLPIDPDSNDLFPRLKNGVIMCKLINKAVEGTIDERAICKKANMSIFHQAQNLNVALSGAKSIGVQVVGIYNDTFIEGKSIPILGLLWQIVKQIVLTKINLKQFPQLVRLLNEGEELSDLLKLKPEDLLIRWFNYHLKNANYPKKVTNLGSDLADSEKYTILLNQLDAGQCDKSALNETDLKKRAETVLVNAKKLGANDVILPEDIVKGNLKLNTLFTAEIFNACPGLDPPTEQEAFDAAKLLDDDVEGGREERSFRMWINSLGIEGVNINNLYEDSKTGILMLKIIDYIDPGSVNWKTVDQKTKNRFKLVVNCNEVVNTCVKNKLSIVGIGGKDINEGNKKFILAIVWQLMRRQSLKIIGDKTEPELIDWANTKVPEEFKIKTLKDKSIKNSLFWIHLLSSIEPRAVDWSLVVTENFEDKDLEMNAKYALSIARRLNATIFIVWEDLKEVKSKLLLTFIAEIFNIAQKYKPQ